MLLQAGVTGDPKVFLAFFLPFAFIWLLYALCSRKRSPYPLPPGPPGKFLVGNLGQLSNHPEQDYIQWGKDYSKLLRNNNVTQTKACSNIDSLLMQTPM